MSSERRSAFDCLMASNKKKRKRLVECPNCGSSILEELIHPHLDSCILKQSKSTRIAPPSGQEDSPGGTNNDPAASPAGEGGANAFAQMMQQSKRLHQTAYQRFHLHADNTLTWTDGSGIRMSDESIKWSASLQLRRPDSPIKMQLTLSTSIAPGTQVGERTRLVQHHSKLSIPVLKSVLQKSIRRRRPLPAIRVAMELVDKAQGELLRRLPIIILEDSTLHPDFALLCWLMAAESKVCYSNYRVDWCLREGACNFRTMSFSASKHFHLRCRDTRFLWSSSHVCFKLYTRWHPVVGKTRLVWRLAMAIRFRVLPVPPPRNPLAPS